MSDASETQAGQKPPPVRQGQGRTISVPLSEKMGAWVKKNADEKGCTASAFVKEVLEQRMSGHLSINSPAAKHDAAVQQALAFLPKELYYATRTYQMTTILIGKFPRSETYFDIIKIEDENVSWCMAVSEELG